MNLRAAIAEGLRPASVLPCFVLLLAGCSSFGAPSGFTLQPGEDSTPLLRTDSTRPDRWDALLKAIATPNEFGFVAFVTALTDPALEGLTEAQIRELPRGADTHSFVLVADAHALAGDGFPILVIDLSGDALPSFRVTAACLWAVENNLSIANMGWEDFSGATDADGVYRTC